MSTFGVDSNDVNRVEEGMAKPCHPTRTQTVADSKSFSDSSRYLEPDLLQQTSSL